MIYTVVIKELVSYSIDVHASSEDEAKTLANRLCDDNPDLYAYDWDKQYAEVVEIK